MTKKDGPNKGRYFYKCQKGPGCNFFQWADATAPNTSTTVAGPSGSRNYGANNFGDSGSSNQARSKRKCGICKQEGHTRLKCPRRMDA